jgi:molecular chaperone GrpE
VNSSDERRPEEQERVVIRDNRKIDPVTGEARKASPAAAASTPPVTEPGEGPKVDAALLEERTRDLQRLQAEYANYRKRAERDRLAAGELAVGRTLAELLPVLDDIDRARAHGDLTGALKAVADHLETVFAKLGLQAFGDEGDEFDPSVHEAVMHDESEDVSVPTATKVLRKGYKHGDRLLRAAMVGVTDPIAPPGLGEHPLEASDDASGAQDEVSDDSAEPADLPDPSDYSAEPATSSEAAPGEPTESSSPEPGDQQG